MKCPFCNIDQEKILEETKNTLTVISNPALVEGHCLVIPKRHIEKLSELNEEELKELFSATIRIEEKLLKKFLGCDISQHYRPFQKEDGTKVNHFHIQVRPREFEDELYKKCQILEKQLWKTLDNKEILELKNLILNLK
jgi:histidine triad (HIT) family protein